jgi:hypothetical protein
MSIHWGGRGLTGGQSAYAVILADLFDSAGSWVLPTGIAISGGTMNKTEAPGTGRTATLAMGVLQGHAYRTTFTLAGRTAGGVRIDVGRDAADPVLGGTGTTRNANGTYSEILTAGPTGLLSVTFTSPTNLGINITDLTVERL